MKKQKVKVVYEEQNKMGLDAIHSLQQGLDQIETFPVNTPNLQWFEQMVLAEQQKIKTKLKKDLFIFSIIALLILGGVMLSLYHIPILFITLQVITTIFIVMYIAVSQLKKVIKYER
jgi:Flp pilus assembly protein TadB